MRKRAPLLAVALALAGCTPAEDWGPDRLAFGNVSLADEELRVGQESYERYCVGCHGNAGDGEGPAARFLDPKPRDLRVGRIKFALVSSGKAPRDEDYLRIISEGLAGTAMPAFPFIPKDEQAALVKYIKTFHQPKKPTFAGAALAIPRDPYRKKPAKGVRDGERMYHGLASCHSCHPAYVTKVKIAEHMQAQDLKVTGFRANLYTPEAKDSDWGVKITPPDFLVDRIKTGDRRQDVVRVVAAGVGGTAMPTWGATLTAKQLWSLAYYVEHLAKDRDTPEGRTLQQELGKQPEFKIPPPPEPEPEPEGSAEPKGSAAPATSAPASSASATPKKKDDEESRK
jgi:mono/diheme cytochrome c family protein